MGQGRQPEKAAALAEQAAKAGAQLIVLPECAVPGYTMDRRMWDWAEPVNGPGVAWLTGLSERLGVYLGIGLVEADGDDFYNAYVLAGPDGKVAGRVGNGVPSSTSSGLGTRRRLSIRLSAGSASAFARTSTT